MKNLPKLVPIILFVCFITVTVPCVKAQRKRTNSRKKQTVSSTTNSTVRRNIKPYPIETEYDRFKDETSIRMFIGVGYGQLLFVTSYEGRNLTKKPQYFTFKYIEPAQGFVAYELVDYYILADGNRLKKTFQQKFIENKRVLADTIYYSDAETIANARSVEFQIGNREFTLTNAQINAVGEFLNRLNPEININADSLTANSVSQSNSASEFNELYKQFGEQNINREIVQLRKLSLTNKVIIREAIQNLKAAILTARISSDLEEMAKVNTKALDSSMKALNILPEGAVKTSIMGSNGYLMASHLLRLYSAGSLGSVVSNPEKEVENIIIKFNLSKIPPQERAAKLLATADFAVQLIQSIAVKSEIVKEQ